MNNGPKPALLIYTDASFHPKTRIASWGAVIVGQEQRVFSAPFKGECESSTLAELQAIANALHIAVASGDLRRGMEAMVLCDCLTVVELLNGTITKGKRVRGEPYQSAVAVIREIVSDTRALITFDWVKGHQTLASDCPHARGNRAADLAAEQAIPGHEERLERKRERNRRLRARRKERLKLARACETAPMISEGAPA